MSKVNVTVIDYWKGFPVNKCFLITSIIAKLQTEILLESRMCVINFGAKSQDCNLLITGMVCQVHSCFPWTRIIMKLHTQTLLECAIDFGVKVQGHNALIIEKGFRPRVTTSLYTYWHENSHTDSPWVKDMPYWFGGQKFKAQSHSASVT